MRRAHARRSRPRACDRSPSPSRPRFPALRAAVALTPGTPPPPDAAPPARPPTPSDGGAPAASPAADLAPLAAGALGASSLGAGTSSAAGLPPIGPGGRPLGRYRVNRRLGSGGFARVYRAWDPELELDVAVKLLRAEFAGQPEVVERFRREAGMAARLRHPNIVTVLTVGRLEEPFDGVPTGTPYLVMDYLPGTLAARLQEVQALPEAEAARIGAEVARGLAHAHRCGIVHRDVKPGNVLFAADGRAVVTDFGIARAVSGAQVPVSRNVVLGTPSYFSPEQARGLPLDGRSDLYALGVSLYEMVSGTLPFAGDDWYSVMRQHVETPPPPLRTVAPGVSQAFAYVVERCLAKEPGDRFQLADELADALAGLGSAARGEQATVAVPALDAPRGGPAGALGRRRRARWPWALGAAAAVLGAVVWWEAGGNARTRRALQPGGGLTVPRDSVAADTLADTAGAVSSGVLARATLEVDAPPSAELRLDEQPIGQGRWRSDSVPVGTHVVRARIPAVGGCPAADTALTLDLAAGEQRVVRLRPPACGRLVIDDVQPVPARFVLASARGTAASGTLPRARAIVLREGTYGLSITHPGCATYSDSVRVAAGGGVQRAGRIRLICG